MSVKLNPDAQLRDLIEIANKNADLRGITESVPSINDIFIKAVEASNQ